MMEKLAESSLSDGKNNVSFISYFLLGELDKCLDILIQTDRIPEAAFFARYTTQTSILLYHAYCCTCSVHFTLSAVSHILFHDDI
jgi:hypothetical protein